MAGLAVVFGLDEDIIAQVAGLIGSIASVVTFIVTEGKVDAASARKTEGK